MRSQDGTTAGTFYCSTGIGQCINVVPLVQICETDCFASAPTMTCDSKANIVVYMPSTYFKRAGIVASLGYIPYHTTARHLPAEYTYSIKTLFPHNNFQYTLFPPTLTSRKHHPLHPHTHFYTTLSYTHMIGSLIFPNAIVSSVISPIVHSLLYIVLWG